ncbi:MAG: ABC transporter substrate-binding protein [Candidatus Heimdallarchaeaceae archaeon]
MKKRRLVIFAFVFLICVPCLVLGQETEIDEYFSITLLSPNDNAERKQYSLLMQHQLPKIGIGVYLHESTTWGNIADRSWSYPLIDYDYIPTYAEGGYDALFVEHSWDLDWDSGNIFTSGCMASRANFYQYNNPQLDAKLIQYLSEPDSVLRTEYLHEIQAILYEDLPSISLVYPKLMYICKEGLTGIDLLLLSLSKFRAENWDDPADHIIKYPIPIMLEAQNVYRETSDYDSKWMAAVYGSLFERSQIFHEWEPVIATNYSLSSDGKNYTVYLDPNAKFSDGSSVLAEDVKYSYELHMTPLVNSPDYWYLGANFASNNSIEIVDTHTLNFNLSSFYAFAMDLLSFGVLDKSSIEPAISTFGYSIFDENPLSGNVQDILIKSCGPFMLDNYSTTKAELIQNPYWNDLSSSNGFQPKLTDLQFIYYGVGRDSVIADLIAGIIDFYDPGFGIWWYAEFSYYGLEGGIVGSLTNQELALNMKHPVFGTGELTPVGTPAAAKSVRKAISHAIPRDVIVDQIYEGLASPGVSPIPKHCIGFDGTLEPYAYDLDLAVDYMEDAGFEEIWHGNGPTPTSGFTITVMLFVLIGLAYLVFTKRR